MRNQAIPILFTDNIFIFPGCNRLLTPSNNPYLKNVLITSLQESEGKFLIVSSKHPLTEEELVNYEESNFFSYGSLVKVELDLENGVDLEIIFSSLRDIQITGLERVKLLEVEKDFLVWKAVYQINKEESNFLNPEEVKVLNDLTEKFIRFLPNLLKRTSLTINDNISYLAIGDLGRLVDFIVQVSNNFQREFKQIILEEYRLEKRLRLLLELEKRSKKLQQNIQSKVGEKVFEQQHAAYLREQLDEIQKQLDKLEGTETDEEDYLKKIENEFFPEEVKKIVREQVRRIPRLHPSEASIIRVYIELLINLPWHQTTVEENNLLVARQQLDRDHFGLDKVKDRIIEHLAVVQKTGRLMGSIICLVGPPGVGKTSLATSIAKATGRKFTKISVGGISDEAEIRGHRRTYLGAMPGKIIQAMKKVQVVNPLFLIDEIDKMQGGGYHGDPASALLEVLDPSQNSKFTDNYLGEVSYDLSKVLFICTANSTNFPSPLLDRMEIIRLSSYTETEKLHISNNHLIPKVLSNCGLKKNDLIYSDESIIEIIRYFTQEAGVRELERNFERISRKFIVEILQNNNDKKLEITKHNLTKYLGKEIYNFTRPEKVQQGLVIGLAYTYSGGDILMLEATYFEGKGELILTGKLGDVMKESAFISLDYVKSNSKKFGINQEVFAKSNLHIHVPEGAIPKDGPSAGVALTTAIISAFSGKLIPTEIGMTGEITLRGRVLAIGGLKEKAIAAHRSGLKIIAIPAANKKDLEDIPLEVRNSLEIIFIENYLELWDFFQKYENKISLPTVEIDENFKSS